MELHKFNPRIRELYGVSLDGRPNYRIARRMIEKRIVNPDDSPFFHQVVECKKYEYIGDEIWVLEKLVIGMANPELIDSEKGSYEPVYIFHWDDSGPKDFSYKEPWWPAVVFLLKQSSEPKAQTAQEAKHEDEEDFKKRRAVCRDVLEEASPWIPSQLKEGYGIVVPNSYEKEEKCSPSPSSSPLPD